MRPQSGIQLEGIDDRRFLASSGMLQVIWHIRAGYRLDPVHWANRIHKLLDQARFVWRRSRRESLCTNAPSRCWTWLQVDTKVLDIGAVSDIIADAEKLNR